MSNPIPPTYIATESGPLRLEFLCHSSIESFDKAAGWSGATLETAHRWHIHRETILRFAQDFIPWIEKLTGVEHRIDPARTARRETNSPNPGKRKPVKETFLTYINRVFAQVSPQVADQIKAEALRLSHQYLIDPSVAERTSPIPVYIYRRADSILEANLDTINARASQYLSIIPEYELARDDHGKPIRESFARLLMKYSDLQIAETD